MKKADVFRKFRVRGDLWAPGYGPVNPGPFSLFALITRDYRDRHKLREGQRVVPGFLRVSAERKPHFERVKSALC